MRIRHIVLVAAGLAFWPGAEARAEFWTALDTEPKPNVVIAVDSSVTMGIEPNACGGNHRCHANPFNTRTRLSVAKRDLLATIPSFQDYFAFGGFRYRGCGSARVQSRIIPNNQDLEGSFNATYNMIQNTGHCNSSERRFPGGQSPSSGCITPTANCSGDQAILTQMANNGVPGVNVTPPANYSAPVACDIPGAPALNITVESLVAGRLGTAGFNWPSFGGTPDRLTVQADLCTPLEAELLRIRSDIQTCTSTPTDAWDMSFLGGNWCDATTIANTLCQPGSLFYGTCVCDAGIPGCNAGVIPRSDCNVMLTWKARQQVAVCETYSPNSFGDFYMNHWTQADNIARGGGPAFCRENVSLFLTDGAYGNRAGVVAEAFNAQPFYRSADALSNMFVFHISNSFRRHANQMMYEVSGHREPVAFRAQNRPRMQESFSKVLSRIYKGVYSGASLTLDPIERRAVIHSFTVPGFDSTGTVGVTDTYLGFPSRLSVHAVRPDGVVEPIPLYETDEQSRVSAGTNGCGPIQVPASLTTDMAYPGVRHSDLLGPGREFRNRVPRTVNITGSRTDRDGDGNPDTHVPLTYGYSFGLGQSTPLIVDAPQDVPTGGGTPADAYNHLQTTRNRPRVIYYQSNGYVIGVHGGDYDATPGFFGDRAYAFQYDDSRNYAGSEVFRYRPDGWFTATDTRFNYEFNDVVQQPLMTGELIAREIYVDGAYRTVLLGNQGKEGRGYFAIDITNPCTNPGMVSEWLLPAGSYASGEPNLYEFPINNAPFRRPVLVATSGLEATNNAIYAYDIANGALVSSQPLPARADHSYPTAPVCVDASGEGVVTHCYALRSDGFLARVEVTLTGLQPAVDVTPRDASNNVVTQAPGRTFYTQPVVFFDNDGAVALVFGSGDYQNLTQVSGTNYVYKVRDENTRRVGVPAGPTGVAQVCAPDGVGNTHGIFRLGAGERLISKPIVEGGLVAWTTYVSRTTGCTSGDGYAYIMNYETCSDAVTNGPRPVAIPIGPGLPTAPTLHQQGQRLLVNTSAGPTAAQVANLGVNTVGNGRPLLKRLYWRLEMNSQ